MYFSDSDISNLWYVKLLLFVGLYIATNWLYLLLAIYMDLGMNDAIALLLKCFIACN